MRMTTIAALIAVAVAGAYAAQDTDITPREVRDPKTLETWLDANAADAQSRLAAVEAGGVGATVTSATLVSNANLKVYGSNLVLVTGGTVTLPSASIASAALPATIANSTTVSNQNMLIHGSNLVLVSGGTITLPSASIASAALPATIANSTTVSNENLFVYGSNVTARTGGTVTMAGTVVLSGLPTSTNGFSVTGSAWNSNGFVCVWAP